MSNFFCQGCQKNKDSDEVPVHEGESGQYCDDCYTGEDRDEEMEKLAKQVDANSIETFELEKRVKKLEDKQ